MMAAPTTAPTAIPILAPVLKPPSALFFVSPVAVEVGNDEVDEGVCPVVAVPLLVPEAGEDERVLVVLGRLDRVEAMLRDGAPTKVVSLTWMMVWGMPAVIVRALLLPSPPLQLHFPLLKSFAQQKRSSPHAASLPSALSESVENETVG